MAILQFSNTVYQYDADKVQTVYDTVENSLSIIDDINEQHADHYGVYNHYKVCLLCGKIVVNSRFGYGSKCYNTVNKMSKKLATISDTYKQILDEYNLKLWIAYANTIRNRYIAINSKDDGTPKNFRSNFKRSFFESMTKAERISRKQLDIMLHDLYNNDLYSCGNEINYDNKLDTIQFFNSDLYEQIQQEYERAIMQNDDLLLFTRITYKQAWVKSPFNDDEQIEIDE